MTRFSYFCATLASVIKLPIVTIVYNSNDSPFVLFYSQETFRNLWFASEVALKFLRQTRKW